METTKRVGVADIRANVDAFYADEIDYETFHLRQGLLWSLIAVQGTDGQTMAAIRRDHAKKAVRS
jgi:hypothetical protein